MLTILGCGKRKLHDGAVGVVVAHRLVRHLQNHPVAGVRVVDSDASEEDALLGARGCDQLIIIDVTEDEDDEPGTITEVRASSLVLPPKRGMGKPKPPLRWHQVLHACRERVGLPRDRDAITVFLVEGDRFGAGVGLSPAVEQAAEEVFERVLARIQAAAGS